MPEPQILYVVTAIVIAGLVSWVAVVLKTAKEPWARPGAASSSTSTAGLKADVPIEGAEEKKSTSEAPSSSLPKVTAGSASGDADATVDATAVKVEKKETSSSSEEKPTASSDEKSASASSDEKSASASSDDKPASAEESAASDEKSADAKKA